MDNATFFTAYGIAYGPVAGWMLVDYFRKRSQRQIEKLVADALHERSLTRWEDRSADERFRTTELAAEETYKRISLAVEDANRKAAVANREASEATARAFRAEGALEHALFRIKVASTYEKPLRARLERVKRERDELATELAKHTNQ